MEMVGTEVGRSTEGKATCGPIRHSTYKSLLYSTLHWSTKRRLSPPPCRLLHYLWHFARPPTGSCGLRRIGQEDQTAGLLELAPRRDCVIRLFLPLIVLPHLEQALG